MSRDGSGVYTKPFPDVVGSTTIASAVYNGFVNDVAADLNAARPVVAGGTGAVNAVTALFNLGAEASTQIVTNFDTQIWTPGSFFAATTASGSPVGGHAFSGQVNIAEALANPPTNANVTVEARDASTGLVYVRIKTANVWGAWALSTAATDAAIAAAVTNANGRVSRGGDTMTGLLVLSADPGAALGAATKQYVDAVATTAAGKVSKGGDTMTGLLVLSADPAAPLGAATKQYADAAGNNRVRYDAAQGLTAAQQAQARTNIAAALRGQLWGLTLSTAGASSVFGIALGECASENVTNNDLMVLASAYTKTTAAWAVGTGNGALDTGAIAASTWYYAHVIKRLDTGVVDVLVSLSPTAPTLPTNYTLARRIGAMRTNGSSQWVKFRQVGDDFIWGTPTVDQAGVDPSTTGNTYTLSVPPGITTKADVQYQFTNSVTAQVVVYIESNLTDILASGVSAAYTIATGAAGVVCSQRMGMWTTNGTYHGQSNTATNNQLFADTFGWTDQRGRLG